MANRRTDDFLEPENESSLAPRRQNRMSRSSASRTRANAKRKTKASKSKTAKIGGMHQRANKRIGW